MTNPTLNVLSDESPFVHPGHWWHADGDRIVCDLCPRKCALQENDRGFCFVRQNVGGQMMLTTFGRSTGFCIDPIEKKPLNHFFPGTSVLSFGTAGCNLGCKFCQNWDISKSREVERLSSLAMPDAIARAARDLDCHSVAFTYNDPIIWAEYAIETAKECRNVGVKTVAVTAGYITSEAREDFYTAIDAANVDLKAFTEDFYYKLTLSHLDPILETLIWLKRETDVWFEITNLIIPDANDSPDELKRLCDWVLLNVGDEVPVHFSAFHPDYRMLDRPRTPPETLNLAREIALRTGLKYAYVGNVDDTTRQSTYCGRCGKLVIERNWYALGQYNLHGAECAHCGHRISGHFADAPGDWGRKRQRVDMRTYAGPNDFESTHSVSHIGNIVGNPTSSAGNPASEHSKGIATVADTTLDAQSLSATQESAILDAASEFLQAAISDRKPASDIAAIADLGTKPIAGTFVSLKRKGQLRSCCGVVGQIQPLTQSLHRSAQRTATDDPRFPPVSAAELPHLEMEVWLLGESRPIAERGADRVKAVEVGRDGLQVIGDGKRGLLLPGVPVDRKWNAEEFLNQTCIKAGLPPTAWKDDSVQVLKFPGRALHRAVLTDAQALMTESSSNLFTAREFAQYAQHCRRTIETLVAGGVPNYYVPEVSDASVSGTSVSIERTGVDGDMSVSRFSWKQGLPLQATLMSQCEEIARVIRSQRLNPAELEVSVLIAHDVALHGSANGPDYDGIDPTTRGVAVAHGNTWAFASNQNAATNDLVDEAVKLLGGRNTASARVLSLHVQTNRETWSLASRPQAVVGAAVRPAAVAGRFYPGDANAVASELDQLFDGFECQQESWSAAMIPHAGWKFSGRVAAEVLSRISIPETVIVIGPKHTPHGVDWAVAPHEEWSLPGGSLKSDPELAKQLAEAIPGLQLDAAAHANEHGIEVELPLIQRLAPDTKVVGITMSGGSLEDCREFAGGLAQVLKPLEKPPLLLISSDMNHFANDAETRRLDELALAEMDELNAESLLQVVRENHISMCGVLPAVVIMETLKQQGGLKTCERVAYATSFDASGNSDRCVGYAGLLLR